MRRILRLLWATLNSWSEDNAFRLSAALAYYAVFSLAPLLIIVIAIAGAVFGEQAAQSDVIAQIRSFIGDTGANAIQGMLKNASEFGARRTASVVGVISLVFGATGVFGSLQDGLNTIWRVKQKPQNFVIGFLRQRLRTFTLVLGTGFLLLTSLLLTTAIEAVAHYFGDRFGPAWVFRIVNFIVSVAIVAFLFAMIFKLVPDVQITWGDVWIGALFTSLLFTAGKLGIAWYVGRKSFTSVYGAAGSLVLILAWVYYSSLILYLGAEFTRVYTEKYGTRIEPKPHAVALTPTECAEAGLEPRKPPRAA